MLNLAFTALGALLLLMAVALALKVDRDEARGWVAWPDREVGQPPSPAPAPTAPAGGPPRMRLVTTAEE